MIVIKVLLNCRIYRDLRRVSFILTSGTIPPPKKTPRNIIIHSLFCYGYCKNYCAIYYAAKPATAILKDHVNFLSFLFLVGLKLRCKFIHWIRQDGRLCFSAFFFLPFAPFGVFPSRYFCIYVYFNEVRVLEP